MRYWPARGVHRSGTGLFRELGFRRKRHPVFEPRGPVDPEYSGKTVEDEEFIKSHDSLKKLFANGYWIGVLLIVLGTILLLNNFIDDVVFNFIDRQYFYMIMDYVPAALLLAAGVLLMIKGNKERKKLKEQKKDEIKE